MLVNSHFKVVDLLSEFGTKVLKLLILNFSDFVLVLQRSHKELAASVLEELGKRLPHFILITLLGVVLGGEQVLHVVVRVAVAFRIEAEVS